MRVLAVWKPIAFHLRRAARWDLRGLPLTVGERNRLGARGIDGEDVPAYMAWRRSTFLVLAGLALVGAGFDVVHSLDFYELWPAGWSRFGIIKEVVRLGAVALLPIAALVAALTWSRPRLSRAVALAGWLVSLLVPVVLAFFPLHWSVNLDALSLGETEQRVDDWLRLLEIPATANDFMGTVRDTLAYLLDLIGALIAGVFLLPALLALIPGTLRACVRVKLLVPESIVPGWFLVTLVPFYVLLWLVVVIVVVNVRAGPLILGSVVLMAVAPSTYLLQARPLVRPLTEAEARGIRWVRLLSSACVAAAFVLLAIYLSTKEFIIEEEHLRLVGLDPDASVMMPWEPFSTGLDYVTRALFTTAVMTDLFLQIHLSAWRRVRGMLNAEAAEKHDRHAAELARGLSR
jgi:hypothetical protein